MSDPSFGGGLRGNQPFALFCPALILYTMLMSEPKFVLIRKLAVIQKRDGWYVEFERQQIEDGALRTVYDGNRNSYGE